MVNELRWTKKIAWKAFNDTHDCRMTGKYDISFLFYLPLYLAVATTPIRYDNTHLYYIYLPVYLKVPIPTRYDNTNLHEYLYKLGIIPTTPTPTYLGP